MSLTCPLEQCHDKACSQGCKYLRGKAMGGDVRDDFEAGFRAGAEAMRVSPGAEMTTYIVEVKP